MSDSEFDGDEDMMPQEDVAFDKKQPHYVRASAFRAKINTAAPLDLRALLLALAPNTRADAADIGRQCVETQLKAWEKIQRETRDADTSLGSPHGVDLDAVESLKTHDAAKAVADIAARAPPRALWTWERLPYAVRQAGLAGAKDDAEERPKKKARAKDSDDFVADVDEWILRNEAYLRRLSRAAKLKADAKPSSYGLLRLEDIPLVVQTHEASAQAVKIVRAPLAAVPGYSFLDQKRADAVYVQPNVSAFQTRWKEMTGGLLDGLDWSNVCVAGGLVLGTILTPNTPEANKASEWQASDIDLYIYGLSVAAANAKIQHIAEVYRKNLRTDAPFLAVRNAQTVTFYSAYPTRRVQVVLKLVSSPREVLLNFDLDVVAAAYDGTEVWMLPRFVRAIETGSNIFTMDLINGHYLGDRKATRDKRVFKYANKGYALRILPSYIAALSTYNTQGKLEAQSRGDRLFLDLNLEARGAKAREWTQGVVRQYLRVGHAKTNAPFYWPKRYPRVESDVPVFSHAMLEGYGQTTSEPLGRSCLTGFSLLMRHVALWEEELAGKIKIYEDLYATDTYGEGPRVEVAYDDSPAYTWDESFSIPDFKRALDDYNKREKKAARLNTDAALDRLDVAPVKATTNFPIARITYADSADALLAAEKDLRIPLVLPLAFMRFANETILAGLARASVPRTQGPLTVAVPVGEAEGGGEVDAEQMVIWQLDSVLNWQMLDRAIDEVREVLWAFHRANERMHLTEEEHNRDTLVTTISRRAIRVGAGAEEEMDAFVRWVGRAPYEESTKINAIWRLEEAGGFGSSDEEGDEDDDE
ncbi:hypothetical protein AURDEDRAFT_158081 [Auricularia subglabra TFB-10046 SS5]|nr:hypothetical protein AURDEDRAFT_158081 [Auricularia subglabra TFB-10046 SS5]